MPKGWILPRRVVTPDLASRPPVPSHPQPAAGRQVNTRARSTPKGQPVRRLVPARAE